MTATYEPLIAIPAKGLRFHAWARAAVAGHRFLITFNHYDANRKWMSGRNNDQTFAGTGRWQEIDQTFSQFPEGAAFVQMHLRATLWTEAGDNWVWCGLTICRSRTLRTGGSWWPGGILNASRGRSWWRRRKSCGWKLIFRPGIARWIGH